MKRLYAIVLISLAVLVTGALARQSSTPATPAGCPMMAKHEKVMKMAADLTASFERVRTAKDDAARKAASDEHARLLAEFQQTVSESMACARKQASGSAACGEGGCCKMRAEGAAGCCAQGAACCQGHAKHAGAGCCAAMAHGQ
ncbi:MAG TPA: hypothetical protein VNK82_00865 [Terriglobales bacterium]|nr:hypothetical protein [Terriglobales bacterium]